MIEKDVTYPKMKNGVSKKYKVDNFKFERYKPFKDSNVGCIQISCWVTGGGAYKSSYAVHRDIKRCWDRAKIGYEDGLGRMLIFVPDFKDNIVEGGKSFVTIDVQFTKERLSPFMNEMMYDVLEDMLIETIESSKLVVI